MTPGRFLRRYMPAIVIIITAALCILFAVISGSDRATYLHILREDGPVEWATAVLAFLAGLLALYHALRTWQTTRTIHWFAIGFGLACLFIGFEEISWGQRLFGLETPDFVAQYNTKDEINLHNMFPLFTGLKSRHIYSVGILLYGVTLPLLSLAAPVRRSMERYNVIVPGLSLVPLSLAAGLLALYDQPTGEEEEYAEMLITAGFFLLIAMQLIRTGTEQPAPDRRSLFSAPLVRTGILLATLVLAAASAIVLLAHQSDNPAILGRYSLTYVAYLLYNLTVIVWWAGLALLALFRWGRLKRVVYWALAAGRGRLYLAAAGVAALYAVSLIAASFAPAPISPLICLAPVAFLSGAVLVAIPVFERLIGGLK